MDFVLECLQKQEDKLLIVEELKEEPSLVDRNWPYGPIHITNKKTLNFPKS